MMLQRTAAAAIAGTGNMQAYTLMPAWQPAHVKHGAMCDCWMHMLTQHCS
jgi:hypothetical protein